jgi:hypothetical protein
MVSELLNPDAPSVPERDYKEMRRLSRALPNQFVWVGYRYEQRDRQLVALTTGWPQPDSQKVAYAKTLAVGCVLFVVFGHNIEPSELWAEGKSPLPFTPIWPATRALSLPDRMPLAPTPGNIEAVHDMLINLMLRYDSATRLAYD